MGTLIRLLNNINTFFLLYLFAYTTYLFISVVTGAYKLYLYDRMRRNKNIIHQDYYRPISILVPAHNEEVTIVDSITSLLHLNYKLYEIIVIDDGSTDKTAERVIRQFGLQPVTREIGDTLKTKPLIEAYEAQIGQIRLTLLRKENGGKGDALNMGINASVYPYFLCIDADSMLQKDSLEYIIRPMLEDEDTVAVGGLVRIAQCVVIRQSQVMGYRIPWNPLIGMQVMEYDRSFLASRILMDMFNGNLIISGAFGLFKKDIAVAAGGYDPATIGEDMELVMRMHVFCRNMKRPYAIRFEPNAICWSQAPASLRDLRLQRRRWHLGLFQSLYKHRGVFLSPRFGAVGFVSYLYYLIYELLSPFIEVGGWITVLLSALVGILNARFMIGFFLLYAIYGAVLSVTAFFQRIYTQNLYIEPRDVIKAILMCVVENVFFRFVLDFVRATAFIGYRKRKRQWGKISRAELNASPRVRKMQPAAQIEIEDGIRTA